MTRQPALSDHAQRFREYLAEVTRDRLGRFVHITAIGSCTGVGAALPPTDVQKAFEQEYKMPSDLRHWLVTDEGTRRDLATVIDDFLDALDSEAQDIADEAQRNLANGRGPNLWATVDPGELDVSGFDAPTARHVALLLKHWGHKGSVYRRRNGRRELRGELVTIDLSNPLIQQLGWTDHVEALAEEGAADVSFEDYNHIDWDNLAAMHYGERYATEAA